MSGSPLAFERNQPRMAETAGVLNKRRRYQATYGSNEAGGALPRKAVTPAKVGQTRPALGKPPSNPRVSRPPLNPSSQAD